jgi:hypothetical protein
MSRNKCFSRFEYHMFYVLYQFATYILSLPRSTVTIYAKLHSVFTSYIYKYKIKNVRLSDLS